MDADMPTTGKGPAANLAARRAAGQVHADPVQEKVVAHLQAISEQLKAATSQPAKAGLLSWLGLGSAAKPAAGPHGLYIWGPVGRGKSMLMDLFFADAPVAKKRRVHFHAARGAGGQGRAAGGRHDRADRQGDRLGDAAAVLRRVPGH
jgi:cell division protein ZapE